MVPGPASAPAGELVRNTYPQSAPTESETPGWACPLCHCPGDSAALAWITDKQGHCGPSGAGGDGLARGGWAEGNGAIPEKSVSLQLWAAQEEHAGALAT